MAIIDDDGKIRGAIGNYVYRRLNKKGVVQSHPGTLKPKGDTILENKRFGGASKINKIIYPYIKRSGLNMCFSYVYGKLVNYFKRVLYTDLVDKEKGEYLYLDENNSLAKVFQELPTAERTNDIVTVQIPALDLTGRKFVKGAFMEYRMQLWHLDYKSTTVSCLYNNIHGGLNVKRKTEAHEIQIEFSKVKACLNTNENLSEIGVSLEEGLLVMCFGVKFYEDNHDLIGLNSKKFNPAAVLGAWHLGLSALMTN